MGTQNLFTRFVGKKFEKQNLLLSKRVDNIYAIQPFTISRIREIVLL